jgi:hypothetical protein
VSAGAQPDYEALAKKYGGSSGDLEELAKRYGGATSEEKPMSGVSGSWEPESTSQKVWGALEGAGVGAAKGLGHTLTGLSPLLNKIPYIGETLAPTSGINAWEKMTAPEGAAQKTGYYGEQLGEFLAPGPAEEKGAAELAEHIPQFGRFAAPASRIAANALSTGAVNKLQGGSFGGGVATGGAFGALGEGGRALAPSLAESALGITKKMRGFGKTPGEAALNEITGIRPGTMAGQAQEKLLDLTRQLETAVANSNVPASTSPALRVIDDEIQKAASQNSKTRYEMLQALRDHLTKEFTTGQTIPSQVAPSKILDLKRGIGDLDSSWNPDVRSGMRPVIRKVYNALDKELDRTVPEADKLNQRISSLIPVAQQAESAERGAGMGQRVAHRLAAHTGALAGTGIGSYLGYERGGTPGALIGGGLGLAIPEVLASPSTEMLAARAATSPTIPRIARGGTEQLFRPTRSFQKPKEKKEGSGE